MNDKAKGIADIAAAIARLEKGNGESLSQSSGPPPATVSSSSSSGSPPPIPHVSPNKHQQNRRNPFGLHQYHQHHPSSLEHHSSHHHHHSVMHPHAHHSSFGGGSNHQHHQEQQQRNRLQMDISSGSGDGNNRALGPAPAHTNEYFPQDQLRQYQHHQHHNQHRTAAQPVRRVSEAAQLMMQHQHQQFRPPGQPGFVGAPTHFHQHQHQHQHEAEGGAHDDNCVLPQAITSSSDNVINNNSSSNSNMPSPGNSGSKKRSGKRSPSPSDTTSSPLVGADIPLPMDEESAADIALLNSPQPVKLPPAPPPDEIIPTPLDADVISGRGGESNHHPGNIFYRHLVKKYQPIYIRSKRRDKPRISQLIVARVRQRGARFLKKDPNSTGWRDIGNHKAREKTSQALREGAPELRGSANRSASPTSLSNGNGNGNGAVGVMSSEQSTVGAPLQDSSLISPSPGVGRPKIDPSKLMAPNERAAAAALLLNHSRMLPTFEYTSNGGTGAANTGCNRLTPVEMASAVLANAMAQQRRHDPQESPSSSIPVLRPHHGFMTRQHQLDQPQHVSSFARAPTTPTQSSSTLITISTDDDNSSSSCEAMNATAPEAVRKSPPPPPPSRGPRLKRLKSRLEGWG